MRRFVLDEWLWADLGGENGEKAQQESLQLLLKIFERCDQLVTVEGGAFLEKFYRLCEIAEDSGDPRRRIVRVFKYQFLYNSKKLICLSEEELPDLPEEMANTIEEKDRYLVRAYWASDAELVVTTDNPLLEALRSGNVKCQHRDSFLPHYSGAPSA